MSFWPSNSVRFEKPHFSLKRHKKTQFQRRMFQTTKRHSRSDLREVYQKGFTLDGDRRGSLPSILTGKMPRPSALALGLLPSNSCLLALLVRGCPSCGHFFVLCSNQPSSNPGAFAMRQPTLVVKSPPPPRRCPTQKMIIDLRSKLQCSTSASVFCLSSRLLQRRRAAEDATLLHGMEVLESWAPLGENLRLGHLAVGQTKTVTPKWNPGNLDQSLRSVLCMLRQPGLVQEALNSSKNSTYLLEQCSSNLSSSHSCKAHRFAFVHDLFQHHGCQVCILTLGLPHNRKCLF